MLNLTARMVAVVTGVATASCHAEVQLPPAVESFRVTLNGDISPPRGRFNATDVVDGKPTRRILGYQVGESSVLLWYEHGGRGYHQHLVRLNAAAPYQVEESYAVGKHEHRDIDSLLRDRDLLRVARSEEL
jgi:hypothetical protein